MKKQPRFITILIGTLLSGVALQATAANTINPDSGTSSEGAGGQVIFNGSITDSSCNVDSSSNGQKVDLGKWASNYFTGTGFETTKTPSISKWKIARPAWLRSPCCLTARAISLITPCWPSTAASGVAIKLYEHDRSTAVSLGKTSAKQTVTPGTSGGTGSADLEFYADYISTAATVTAGKADGTANFNMIYNWSNCALFRVSPLRLD